MKKLYALLTKKGTACSETCMCESCFANAKKKAQVEERAKMSNQSMYDFDKAVFGTWRDVTKNDYLQKLGCVAC